MTSLIQQNIANLTSLWRTVGQRANGYQTNPDFDMCTINDSDWPNKLWFHADVDEQRVQAAVNQLRAASAQLTVLYWHIYHSQSYQLLEAAGLQKTSEQVGMCMELKQPLKPTQPIRLESVTSPAMALDWETLFTQAFGYRIPASLLVPAYPNTDFLLAYYGSIPIGTCALHQANDQTIGIHSVGIVPDMRGKGLAGQLMISLLNRAIGYGFTYATLQASAMGKGLYQKLGFNQQFIQMNYKLPAV